LLAYYAERGAPIVAWSSGHFTGWETPGSKIPIVILTALLTARQGVKHIGVSLGLGVHVIQDTAALRVMHALLREYLDRFGFTDVTTYLISYPFLGMWPADIERTSALVSLQATIGLLAGVDWMIVKSLDEAFSIPRPEGNLASMKIVKQILDVSAGQRLDEGGALEIEMEMLEAEVRASIDRTIELGDGQVTHGMVKAVEMGVLDGTFSPWTGCQNKVLTVRDRTGALRYFTSGNMPLPKEVREYNEAKLAEVETATGRRPDMETVIADIQFLARPLVPSEAAE
jgi:methylaspartate mutase epsilon subunit